MKTVNRVRDIRKTICANYGFTDNPVLVNMVSNMQRGYTHMRGYFGREHTNGSINEMIKLIKLM